MSGHRKICTIHRTRFTEVCPECDANRQREYKQRERERGSAASRMYDHRWREARDLFLKQPENRNCVYCLEKTPPKKRSSEVVDHFIPHKGDLALFWDKSNWRPACKRCHDKKTATMDGGFGRKVVDTDTR